MADASSSVSGTGYFSNYASVVYQSEATLLGLPILHVSFKYRPDRRPVPAKGVIAIGQFAYRVVTISQFGLGVFSLGQFTIAGFALAQLAIAYPFIAQFGIFLHQGRGQLVWSLADIIRQLRYGW